VTPELDRRELHIFEHKAVAAGETVTIIDYPVSGGYVAFIERIACDLPYEEKTEGTIALMWHEFIIDGVPEKIQYEIPINNPRRYDPPKVARTRVKWRFYNADSKSHTIGILIEGQLCKPKL